MLIEPHPFSAMLAGGQAHLRIMQTSDLHAHIFPYDYYNDHPIEWAGLARVAALVAQIRAQSVNTLLLDGGDVLQGSALGDYMAHDRGLRMGDLHPVIAAMNVLGYDAATLGNHEFNYGLEFLLAALAGSDFPYVCANVLTKRGADARRDTRLLKPYALLDRMLRDGLGALHPIRIGVLGLVPPQIVTWDETQLRGAIQSRDMIETAAALIPEMQAAGADIIIALAHTGIGDEEHLDGMENAAHPLARLPGIDALALGHMHMLFPSPQFADRPGVDLTRGTLNGKPAVMPGFCGSHLGVIDLKLQRGPTGWEVLDSGSEVMPIATFDSTGNRRALVTSEPRVLAAAQAEHDLTLEYMRFAVGYTSRPLHSFFAQIKDCATVQIVCHAQRNYIAKKLAGTPHANLPLLSAAAPFKAGGWAGPTNFTHIPVGPIYQRSVADLYCFPNTICALRLRGADIAEWLERGAAAFHRVVPGLQDQPLLNDDFPSYNFDIIFGVTYEIDPSQPARYSIAGVLQHPEARRIRNLRYMGQPIDPCAEFVVASNNYRASTHLAMKLAGTAKLIFESSVTIRNILLNEVADASPLNVIPEPNWRFAPMPGTSFLFETSPDATPTDPCLTDITLEPMGKTPTGFARYRMFG